MRFGQARLFGAILRVRDVNRPVLRGSSPREGCAVFGMILPDLRRFGLGLLDALALALRRSAKLVLLGP